MNTDNIVNDNIINDNICIVTAFFDIGRGEWNNEYKRSSNFYLESFLHYLDYPYNMVCFIDDRYIDTILQYYTKSSYHNKKFIPINEKWLENNIHSWKQIYKDKEILSSDEYKKKIEFRKKIIVDLNLTIPKNYYNFLPENENPKYNSINHSKIDFIMYSIQNGYIKEDITCWCDFGYFGTQHKNNKETFPTSTLDITKFSNNKITFFLKKNVEKKDLDPNYTLIYAPEVFTGTFWGGPTNLMSKMQELYHNCVEELYSINISDDDQHIYLRCCLKQNDMFDLKLCSENPKGLLYFQIN